MRFFQESMTYAKVIESGVLLFGIYDTLRFADAAWNCSKKQIAKTLQIGGDWVYIAKALKAFNALASRRLCDLQKASLAIRLDSLQALNLTTSLHRDFYLYIYLILIFIFIYLKIFFNKYNLKQRSTFNKVRYF